MNGPDHPTRAVDFTVGGLGLQDDSSLHLQVVDPSSLVVYDYSSPPVTVECSDPGCDSPTDSVTIFDGSGRIENDRPAHSLLYERSLCRALPGRPVPGIVNRKNPAGACPGLSPPVGMGPLFIGVTGSPSRAACDPRFGYRNASRSRFGSRSCTGERWNNVRSGKVCRSTRSFALPSQRSSGGLGVPLLGLPGSCPAPGASYRTATAAPAHVGITCACASG